MAEIFVKYFLDGKISKAFIRLSEYSQAFFLSWDHITTCL